MLFVIMVGAEGIELSTCRLREDGKEFAPDCYWLLKTPQIRHFCGWLFGYCHRYVVTPICPGKLVIVAALRVVILWSPGFQFRVSPNRFMT